jgi:hypothetical protein
LGYQVHEKWSILANDPAALVKIEELRFDGKVILEYEMLVNDDFFLGVLMSSMSSMIACARAINDPELFFPTYIYPGSTVDGRNRNYPDVPSMKGNQKTKLMTVLTGKDIMPFSS